MLTGNINIAVYAVTIELMSCQVKAIFSMVTSA